MTLTGIKFTKTIEVKKRKSGKSGEDIHLSWCVLVILVTREVFKVSKTLRCHGVSDMIEYTILVLSLCSVQTANKGAAQHPSTQPRMYLIVFRLL